MTDIEKLQAQFIELYAIIRDQQKDIKQLQKIVYDHTTQLNDHELELMILQKNNETNVENIAILAEELEIDVR